MPESFTIINETHPTDVDVTLDGDRIRLTPNAVERALGWALQTEGFCRDGVCVPVREGSSVVVGGSVDLAALADLLGRPLAIDIDERAAVMGASAQDRAMTLSSLEAPDFTLPDLDGRMHSLSAHRGRKVFLAVWASW